jgi:ribosomal protein L40E
MAKFQEAINRMFGNVFVCKKCKTKRRADPTRVLKGLIPCRRCGYKAMRPISKGKK